MLMATSLRVHNNIYYYIYRSKKIFIIIKRVVESLRWAFSSSSSCSSTLHVHDE